MGSALIKYINLERRKISGALQEKLAHADPALKYFMILEKNMDAAKIAAAPIVIAVDFLKYGILFLSSIILTVKNIMNSLRRILIPVWD
ncbi:hypothetical protein ES707_20691 [subsurface metagenome]